MTGTQLFTGYKAVTLDDLPEEAWTIVTGGGKDTRASTLYGLVGWLHRCVDIRASSLATMPWTIKRGETVLLTSDDGITPDFQWMETLPDLLYRTEAAVTLTGRAYWFRERNRVKTLGLRWLHPLSVRPEINERDGLTHFTRTLGDGVEKRFELDDIVYLWVPDPFVEIGPAEHFPGKAALQAAGILSNMDEFLASYFARGLIKATLLTKMPTPGLTTGPQKTSDDERSRVLEWWRRATGGIKNANVTEMATGDFRPIVVGEGLQDLQNTSLTTEQREAIATALGVPHSKVTANAANFATANQDARSFVTDTMIPETRWIGAELNRQIFSPMGLQFDFQPESLAIMQDDEAQRAASLEALVRAGMSLEVAVRILGYDLPQDVPLRAVAESATVSIQPQPQPLPDSDLEAERRRFTRWAKRRRSPDVDDFDSDLLSREDKLALLGVAVPAMPPFATGKAIHDPLDPDGRQMRRYEREFEDSMIRALSQLRRDVERGITDDNVRDMPTRLLDPAVVLPFQDAVISALTTVAHAGVGHGRSQIEGAIFGVRKASPIEFGAWDLANTAAAEWALTFGQNLAGMMLRLTSERIQIAVSQYILTGGQTIGQLINVIRNGYHYSPERARAIAVTEVTRAYARGNVEAWRASGVVSEKQVRTNNDEKVCPICGGKSNRVYALDDPDGDPPFHTKCRCWIVPKVV